MFTHEGRDFGYKVGVLCEVLHVFRHPGKVFDEPGEQLGRSSSGVVLGAIPEETTSVARRSKVSPSEDVVTRSRKRSLFRSSREADLDDELVPATDEYQSAVTNNTLESLVALQAFDGSWSPSADLFRLLGVSEAEVCSAFGLGQDGAVRASDEAATAALMIPAADLLAEV